METRKVRTPSARLLEAALDDGYTVSSIKMPDLLRSFVETREEKASSRPAEGTRELKPRVDGQEEQGQEQQPRRQTTPDAPERKIENEAPSPEDFIEVGDVENHENDADDNAETTIDVENVKQEQILITHEEEENSLRRHVESRIKHARKGFDDAGETLSLKTSDLSIPNKAAHFLYFRCYDEKEVQKEFPLTIDYNRKGFQNFLVEPRVGLRNTDYYIDNYLWNRGKSTSSKKRIYVEVDGNRVKTSRKNVPAAPYVLNWYYSNLESRLTKKVCWLETCPDGVRASPVLVQYHVNFVSDVPIECRRTPKLYSDTRSVAQAMEMRRLAQRKRARCPKRNFEVVENQNMFFDDLNGDFYEETVYYEDESRAQSSDAVRIARDATRLICRKLESRISAMLDGRLGIDPSKTTTVRVPILQNVELQTQADQLGEWINALTSSTSDDVDIVINNVVGSMRKQLDDILAADGSVLTEFMEEGMASSSSHEPPAKRRHIVEHDVLKKASADFDGNQEEYIYDGQNIVAEYVEEVIAEEVGSSSSQAERTVQHDQAEEDHRNSRQPFFYNANQSPHDD
ncbi:unnamed protein product [Caenorhabditis bovis]|uniref:Uncharacterized protein n=1 Tax=Caenorhabditis bovis TaxID=2654633 RepID=A0A8S1F5L7_9PELO|nr:unnamed protein product [Caenorhabditis bovis]